MTEKSYTINPEEEDYLEWSKIALHDLESAEILIREKGHSDIIIYHCHQCVEKILKSFLIFHKIPFKKIHNLDKLFSDVIKVNKSIMKYKDDILFLDGYRAKIRYPFGEDISITEGKTCYGIANRVYKAMKEIM